jgi:RNA polymerase sigma factor (sigma-70 family)
MAAHRRRGQGGGSPADRADAGLGALGPDQPRRRPEAYIRKVLYTTYLTWWRRRWRGELPSGTLPDTAGPRDLADESATREVVGRALARLSGRQRAVVVLRFGEDRSIADTAALLGCTAGTVKTQTSRALAVLRTDADLLSLLITKEAGL